MSGVKATIALVADQFVGLKPTGQPQIARILESTPGPEQLQPANFPMLAIELSADEEHRWRSEAIGSPGLARHDYTLKVFLFTGSPGTGTTIPQLHERTLAWIQPIAEKLFANLTLTSGVAFMGSGDGSALVRYRIGGIRWNDTDFYGLIITLPVTEKHRITIA